MAATMLVGTILMHIRMFLNIVTASTRDLHPWLLITCNVVENVVAFHKNVFWVIAIIVAKLVIKPVNAILSSVICSSKMVVLVPIRVSTYSLTMWYHSSLLSKKVDLLILCHSWVQLLKVCKLLPAVCRTLLRRQVVVL